MENPTGKPFSWSASRHDSFMSCRRRYYYSYYASAQDTEIYRLKKLSALPLWAGSVVHDTIESFLRGHDSLPAPEEQEALIRSVVHSGMLGDWRVSEAAGIDGAAVIAPPRQRPSPRASRRTPHRCRSGSSSTSTGSRSSRRTSASPSTP